MLTLAHSNTLFISLLIIWFILKKTVIAKAFAWHYKNDDALEQSHDILLCDKSDILCKRCSKEEREYVSQSFTIRWPSSEILHFNYHYDKIRVILCTY